MHFILLVSAAMQTIMNIPNERKVFLREYSSNLYSVSAYLTSKMLVELPLLLLHSILLFSVVAICYSVQGREEENL